MSLLRIFQLALAALLFAATGAHAQIAFRGASSAGAASGSPATITHASQGGADTDTGGCPQQITPGIPGGTAAGDMLIAVVTSKDNGALTMNGWNLLYADAPLASYQVAVFWRIATGGDPNQIDKTGGGCNVMIGRISRFTGVDSVLPFDGGVGASFQSTVQVNTGSITTGAATSMLVVTAHTADNSGTNAPGGLTEAWDSTTGAGSDASISLKYQLQTTAGAKGPFSMNQSGGADPNHGVLFALRPARPLLTVNVPAGTVAGDFLMATIAVRDETVVITPPAGWNAQAPVVQGSGNGNRQQVFTRVADGTEPASYTWLFESAHTGAVGAIVSYQGVDTASPIDALGGNTTPQGGDSNLEHRALGLTTTALDTMLVSAHSFSSAETWNPPAGMTERVDVASQGTPNAAGISLSMHEVEHPFAAATGDKVATANGNGDTGAAHLIALRPLVLPPRLHWSMDETAWSGAAGEVQDLSGNGLHGTAVNGPSTASATPAIAGSPGTCRYGVLDGASQFVEVADNALLDLPDELTVMAWIRPETLPGSGLMTIISKDENYEFHLMPGGQVNWWWGGGAQSLTSSGSVAVATWTHVAIVYSRARGMQRIYLNGVADANTNNQTGALTLNADPFQVGGDQGFAGRFFDGLVDEVYVFAQGLGQGRIQQVMNATRPCALLDHYNISHTGSGVACDTHQVTLTAHDASHTPVDAGARTVSLSTANGRGTWTGIAAGGGILTDATPGDGAATYQFAVGSNSVILEFRYADLAATSETFGFNASDGTYSEISGTAASTEDPSFTMAQAGFRFNNVTDGNTTIPVQISGKPSSAGWNAKTIRLQAIRTDTATGSCVGLFGSQARSVELGAECNSPAACAGRQVSINAGNIATSNDNGGSGAAAYTSVSLNFNAASEADAVIAYPDAGQVSLHARYDLDPDVAGFEGLGGSNTFVVRPFGLAFPGVSHSSTATGALLAAAGDNFAMTVQGYQWAAGEDADVDGVPDAGVNITDNGTVPNFAATAMVGVSANLPGVALGSIARGAGCAGAASIALAGGAGAAADWCYSEAGNAIFTAQVSNYLAAGVDISGSSGLDGDAAGGYVGRFRPKHFTVTGTPTLTHRTDLACASTFTYLGEQLTLAFTLEARNAQNAITQNYNGAYAKLALTPDAASLGIGARSGATNLTARVDPGLAPAGSFANGVAGLTVPTAVRRATPDNPDGPFAATQFGIAPMDTDGTAMGTLDLDVDGAGGNDHFAIAPVADLRFGRLRLQNAYGPLTQALPIPLQVQYWGGSAFVTNADDSCTALNRSDIALAFSGALNACETAVQQASLAFAGGAATLTLAAPGAGNTGTVLLTPQLGAAAGTYCPAVGAGTAAASSAALAYLLGRWDDAANPDADANTAYDDNPPAQAGFGLYGSQPQNFIFFRENY